MRPGLLPVVLTGILAVAAGWLLRESLQRERAASPADQAASPTGELIGQRRPDFTLGAADGRRVSAADFDGQVLLLNFWATWCKPCRAEMPMLSDLQQEHAASGLAVVGIALDDVQRARAFARELGIAYTVLVGAADVLATGVMYGNRAGLLPYTVLVDRSGIVRWTHLGELDGAELRERLEPML